MRIQTWLYSAAQALALTSAVITVSISAMVGKELAPVASLSTLSYGAQFAAIIFCSYLLSMSMKRFGRKPIFYLGALTLALGGGLGALSIYWHSFSINVIAHISFGVSLSAFAFFRFAAIDGVRDSEKAKVLSIVTLGGIVAAFIGPLIAKNGRLFFEDYAFSGSYLAFVVIAMVLMVILMLVPKEQPAETLESAVVETESSGDHHKILSLPLFVSIYASGFGFMLMGLLMMQSSMVLNAQGVEFADIMFVIQCHVVAMFVPSLFMGKVIARVGAQAVIFAGYMMMLAAMLVAIYSSGYYGILTALIGIGLGWNMLYVGGSAMVTSLKGDRHKLQGINESAVAVLNTIGAFSAGALFFAIGWENSNWLAMLLLVPGILLLIANRYTRQTTPSSVRI
ncbi:MAG: MFS transporter [Oceanospirillaceae bacterium]|nr:MFS transporter [Oceanospirillaceae bacterium]